MQRSQVHNSLKVTRKPWLSLCGCVCVCVCNHSLIVTITTRFFSILIVTIRVLAQIHLALFRKKIKKNIKIISGYTLTQNKEATAGRADTRERDSTPFLALFPDLPFRDAWCHLSCPHTRMSCRKVGMAQ